MNPEWERELALAMVAIELILLELQREWEAGNGMA